MLEDLFKMFILSREMKFQSKNHREYLNNINQPESIFRIKFHSILTSLYVFEMTLRLYCLFNQLIAEAMNICMVDPSNALVIHYTNKVISYFLK